MKIANVQPNTQEWLDLRKNYDTASEASAAHGVSKYTSRTDLMKQKVTGMAPEVGNAKQVIFDRGHESEAMARPLAEEIIGSELYPVTVTMEVDGLKLLASLDGATMDEETIWEHKLWSTSLAADVLNDTLPPHYTLQMDQQLLVSGASKCLFMVSDGTKENMAWCWYATTTEKLVALVSGWKQFHADLAAYVPAAAVVEAVGHTPETLPALRVEVTGMVTASNLAEYKSTALTIIESINRTLETDQDFADASKAVKWCGEVESGLEAVKQHALSQTASIDLLFKTIDDIKAKAKETRIELDKLVTRRNTERKEEIILGGKSAYQTHLDGLKAETEGLWVVLPTPDFAGAIKGMRLLANMQDAVNTLLANSKIAADDSAKKIRANLACIKEDGKGFEFLFSDRFALIGKAMDDLKLLVKSRIDAHQAAEDKKAEELRASIRKEEQDKLAADQAAAKLVSDKAAADAQAELDEQNRTPAPVNTAQAATETVASTLPITIAPMGRGVGVILPVRYAMAPAAPKPTTPPALALGEISTRLGFNCTSVFLASLGFEATTVKAAKLFHEADFHAICEAIKTHVSEVQDQYEPATA